MIEVYSKALDQSLNVERIIGRLGGVKPGPTLIFLGESTAMSPQVYLPYIRS